MASNYRHQNTRGISETEAQQLAKLALGDLEEVPVQTCLGPSNAMLVKINDDYLYHDMVVICADDGGGGDDDDDDDDASKPLLDSLFVLSESQCSIGWPLVPKCQIEWPPNCGKKVICKIRKIELSTFVRFPIWGGLGMGELRSLRLKWQKTGFFSNTVFKT